jgi:TrmH family RNA methyltransferase
MRNQRSTLAEGLHLARAIVDAGRPIEAALVRRGAAGAELEACLAHIDRAALHELAPALFDGLAPVEHGAGLLLVIAFDIPTPRRLAGDVLYLDGVQDPGNVGALLRVAAAAQVRNVLAAPGTAALWSPKALRAGQGAHFALTIAEDVAADQLEQWFGGPWIGTEARSGSSLWDTRLPATDLGWMLGSEGAGLSPPARARCSQQVRIPLAEGIESLNVAAAAAVCLFERQRQRQA